MHGAVLLLLPLLAGCKSGDVIWLPSQAELVIPEVDWNQDPAPEGALLVTNRGTDAARLDAVWAEGGGYTLVDVTVEGMEEPVEPGGAFRVRATPVADRLHWRTHDYSILLLVQYTPLIDSTVGCAGSTSRRDGVQATWEIPLVFSLDCDLDDDWYDDRACQGTDCDDGDDEVQEAVWWYRDTDQDGWGDPRADQLACNGPAGWSTLGADCDDANPEIHPGAEEWCDEEDNDCDGEFDEAAADQATWYRDADGDGYGDVTDRDHACEAPAGFVADDDDCDDTNPLVHPDAVETCDDVDSDCDGVPDDVDAITSVTWYPDADGDGFGDTAAPLHACDTPSGYTRVPGDCDDTDPEVHPGASDPCGEGADGVDDDCDGNVDLPAVRDTFYADADGDGFGDPASPTSACWPPPGTVSDASDCDDLDPDVHPGAPEVCENGVDDDCDGSAGPCAWMGDVDLATEALRLAGGAADDGAGLAVLGAGDVDADGFPDLLLGAPGVRDAAGAAYLVPGGPSLTGDLALPSAPVTIVGSLPGDLVGSALASLGDLDGDGTADLLVGAPGASPSIDLAGAGEVALLFGPPSSMDLPDAPVRLLGDATDGALGLSLAGGGDVDGDGLPDALVGAPGAGVGGTERGIAWVIPGAGFPPGGGTVVTTDVGVAFVGLADGDRVGSAVAHVGDVNGDGYDDLLLAAPTRDDGLSDNGVAWLVLGRIALGSPAVWPATMADLALVGDTADQRAGTSLAGVGDTDADGRPDVLVGGPGDDGAGDAAGVAWLLSAATLLDATGSLSLADADARIVGTAAGDAAGTAVGAPGDVDDDGLADLLVAAPGASGVGSACLLTSPVAGDVSLASARATFLGATPGSLTGAALASPGDVDGDGNPDLLLGAPLGDGSEPGAGLGWLVFHPGW